MFRLVRATSKIIQQQTAVQGQQIRRQISGYVSVNNGTLFYEQHGQGTDVVLCIPGALGSTQSDFSRQLSSMSKDFTMVSFDPRGYGKSKKNFRDFEKDFYQADAEDGIKVMEKLGHDKYSVLGWSDGGISGFILAASAPNAVQNLVVWGSNAYVSQQDIDMVNSLKDMTNWSDKMKAPLEDIYGKGGLERLWHGLVDGYCRFGEQPSGNICIERLKDIKCPTMIIHGVKDPMVGTYHAEFVNENIKGSELHIWPEGKHNLHMRFHNEFNELVTSFLKLNRSSKL